MSTGSAESTVKVATERLTSPHLTALQLPELEKLPGRLCSQRHE